MDNYRIKIYKEKLPDNWNDLIMKSSKGSILQSEEWGEFQRILGRKVQYIGVTNGNSELLLGAMLVRNELKGGYYYWYIPHGPVMSNNLEEGECFQVMDFFWKSVPDELSDKKCVFFRMEPKIIQSEQCIKGLKSKGFVKADYSIQPRCTQILNLEKSEDELMAGMHSKTRYNIRLAKRKGVLVREAGMKDGFESFWKMMKMTTERAGFSVHERGYYEKQLEYFAKKDLMKLYVGSVEEDGKKVDVAAIVVSFFGNWAIYHHGASDYRYRKYMAPHLLQWIAIKEAKNRGCREYDFWGVKPENGAGKGEESWVGVTRFKTGFSGKEICYVGSFDKVVRKGLYTGYNKLRGLMRRG